MFLWNQWTFSIGSTLWTILNLTDHFLDTYGEPIFCFFFTINNLDDKKAFNEMLIDIMISSWNTMSKCMSGIHCWRHNARFQHFLEPADVTRGLLRAHSAKAIKHASAIRPPLGLRFCTLYKNSTPIPCRLCVCDCSAVLCTEQTNKPRYSASLVT